MCREPAARQEPAPGRATEGAVAAPLAGSDGAALAGRGSLRGLCGRGAVLEEEHERTSRFGFVCLFLLTSVTVSVLLP